MSEGGRARRFWDARAREDAFFFVDNRLEYGRGEPSDFWIGGERDLDTILETLEAQIDAADTVVEIGCGVGRLTRAIAARARAVIAIDVSSEMLALAVAHNPQLVNVTWQQGDGTSLAPVETQSVTAAISHVVFQHIPDPAVTLGYVCEMGRVLRPGGWAAFQVSTDPAVHEPSPEGWRERLRAAAGRAPRVGSHRNWWGSSVELPALRQAVSAGGMEIETIRGEGTQFCLVLSRKRGHDDD